MTRARESGGYLGGIGTMLGETHSCSECGGIHESRPFGLQHRSRECPAVVLKNFAVVSMVDGSVDAPPEEAVRDVRSALPSSDLPVSFGGVAIPTESPPAKNSHLPLEVPWLPPPDLSEVH